MKRFLSFSFCFFDFLLCRRSKNLYRCHCTHLPLRFRSFFRNGRRWIKHLHRCRQRSTKSWKTTLPSPAFSGSSISTAFPLICRKKEGIPSTLYLQEWMPAGGEILLAGEATLESEGLNLKLKFHLFDLVGAEIPGREAVRRPCPEPSNHRPPDDR